MTPKRMEPQFGEKDRKKIRGIGRIMDTTATSRIDRQSEDGWSIVGSYQKTKGRVAPPSRGRSVL